MLGRVDEGLKLADELLLTVGSGAHSPIARGILYCNTIIFCRAAHLVPAASAWTDALTAWCTACPEMVAHNGLCRVHKAEILQLVVRGTKRPQKPPMPRPGSATACSTGSPSATPTTDRARCTGFEATGWRPRRASARPPRWASTHSRA